MGGTVDIRVYLVATGSDLSDGLSSAGVRLDNNSGSVASVASTTDITPNAAFNDVGPNDKVANSSYASLNEAVFPSGSVPPTDGRSTSGRSRSRGTRGGS